MKAFFQFEKRIHLFEQVSHQFVDPLQKKDPMKYKRKYIRYEIKGSSKFYFWHKKKCLNQIFEIEKNKLLITALGG